MRVHAWGIFFVVMWGAACTVTAVRVDTLSMRSVVLNRTIEYIVVLPSHYDTATATKPFPVLYLLHCAGGDHFSWLNQSYCDGLTRLIDR